MSSKPKVTKTNETSGSKTDQTSAGQSSGSGFTTASPWAPAENYFLDLYNKASGALGKSQPFGGDWVAGPTKGQRRAVDMLYGAAPGLNQGATDLRTMASRVAGGEFLDPNNPILTEGIAATINPMEKRLMESVMPQVEDAAIRGGAYGGTANALMKSTAAGDFAQAGLDTGSKMTLDWTNNRFGDIFRTPEMFSAANTLDLAPGMTTAAAGEMERGLNQLPIDNKLAKYKNMIEMLWGPLGQASNIYTAGGFREGATSNTGTTKGTVTGQTSGTRDTVETGPEPDMLTQILQGGLGGLSTLSSLGTAFPQTMGALGGGIGSILSGLGPLAFLSDRRLKDNITQVGTLYDGTPVHRFTYKGSNIYQIGLMADEVDPEAVSENEAGIKYVNYEIATRKALENGPAA